MALFPVGEFCYDNIFKLKTAKSLCLFWIEKTKACSILHLWRVFIILHVFFEFKVEFLNKQISVIQHSCIEFLLSPAVQ